MNVLVLGGGGREHAIAWKISQSKDCSQLFVMPGNPGTGRIGKNLAGSPKDFSKVRQAVLDNNVDLVVVGPEDPLVGGLGDFFAEDPALKDVLFIGPCSKGAALEGSKEFAKQFMQRHSIPTAAFRSFTSSSIDEADRFLESLKAPYVLKADGLAAGKGVLICQSLDQAKAELRNMLGGKFGSAGNTVVIEEFLSGIEVSMFILTDGKDYLLLPEAKDYKRIGDGDTGLNTGGMGAVSPVPFVTDEFKDKVIKRIVVPTLDGLREEGIPYKGFIFLGLMNCGGDPYVIEYNVRMGDPETEAVMTRIDSDLLHHLTMCAKGRLGEEKIKISERSALTVVCVSGGYPEGYKKGIRIDGNAFTSDNPDVNIFHMGTSLSEDGILATSGGRVLAITANSRQTDCSSNSETPSQKAVRLIGEGRDACYPEAEKIRFEGRYFRKDIGLDIIRFIEKG